jgi:hypothetical protein
MAFMAGVVVWMSSRASDPSIRASARIPLEDEDGHG